MEEQKHSDPIKLQPSNKNTQFVQWQWQCDLDPWQEKDPAKWNWQDYSEDFSQTIEKAFSLNQEIADLDNNYAIDFKKMLQVNKNDRYRVRRIRRQEQSRFMLEIPEPIVIGKDQKTINEAFGTVQQFLDYIMKRTPEAYGLYQRLKGLPLDSEEINYKDVIEEVVLCIHKGAETRQKNIKSQIKNFISEATEIVNVIKEKSRALRDFLNIILRIYTMESFICYWLNELLRNEDWEEINVLTPYLVCLVYTFKLPDYIMKYEEPKGLMKSLLGYVVRHKIYLYRGAALGKQHLEHYNPEKVKYFSWNGLTSTSRNQDKALMFMRSSVRRAQEQKEAKIGAIFIIETAYASIEDCEGMIDVSYNSRYPEEEEVVLAPGTVFKFLKAQLNEDKVYEIYLKIKKRFNEAQNNIQLLGAIQAQAISKNKAVLADLPSQRSFKLLQLLEGNKLIQKLEIRDSGISEHIMEIIEHLRESTHLKKRDIQLINNTISISNLSILAYYYSPENLSDILMKNRIQFKDALKESDKKMEKLILAEESFQALKMKNQLKELWRTIKAEDQITYVDISMEKLQMSDEEVQDALEYIGKMSSLSTLKLALNSKNTNPNSSIVLSQLFQTLDSLGALKQLSLSSSWSNEELNIIKNSILSLKSPLQNLSFDFRSSHNISNEGLNHLRNSLISLTSLQHLSLNFSFCKKISNEALKHLKFGLIPLTSLLHLSLDFSSCDKISNEGLDHLKDGLLPLVSLQYLSLNFSDCNMISDKGLDHLKVGLLPLTSLQYLSLNFNKNSISDDGLHSLKQAFVPLASLQHLSIICSSCEKISNEGLNHMKFALIPLTSLFHLSLDFSSCDKISDEGLDHLQNGLVSLRSLQYLSLNFKKCAKISDEGLKHLKNGLISLISLQNLSLGFKKCDMISDEGLNHLKDGLIPLKSLKHLSLNFYGSKEISDSGLFHLKNILSSLTSLQSLALNFSSCYQTLDKHRKKKRIIKPNQISDEGLKYLVSGFIPLTSLQTLSLNFSGCEKISDKGLDLLKNVLMKLTSLQSLSLSFLDCRKISDQGLNHVKSGLIPLTSLQYLSLNFGDCREYIHKYIKKADPKTFSRISDEGLNHLKSGLIQLTFLQHLSLNFLNCPLISDKGMDHLKNGLTPLTSLKHLSLNFSGCKEIAEKGLYHLKNGLISLTSLEYLSLNFGDCFRVSNRGLDNLQSSFIALTFLKDLSLSFGDSNQNLDEEPQKTGFLVYSEISDHGLDFLMKGLSQLAFLQNLSLTFSYCHKISKYGGLISLEKGLIQLTSLQRLSLSFLDCKISDYDLNGLKTTLGQTIPHLTLNSCSNSYY